MSLVAWPLSSAEIVMWRIIMHPTVYAAKSDTVRKRERPLDSKSLQPQQLI